MEEKPENNPGDNECMVCMTSFDDVSSDYIMKDEEGN